MMLLRRSNLNDLDGIYQLAKRSGFGITTLPKDISIIKNRLEWSEQSFNKEVDHPENEYYLFVLEDKTSGQIIGTSAIEAYLGHDLPFYSYKLSKRTRICHSLNIRSDYEILDLVNDNQGKSEICTLYLHPEYRHSGNGLLLSKARFLFISQFPQRFAESIIAEMRGVCDKQGHSPFWDNLGAHFFQMDFVTADQLTLSTNKQFISDLMPRHSIYVKMLTKEAQDVIGKPHQSTVPAFNILNREGFRYNNYIDIFDGGPTIEAPKDEIKSISFSQLMTIKDVVSDISTTPYLLANASIDYKATVGSVCMDEINQTCTISRETAELLQLTEQDRIRIIPLHHNNHKNSEKG